MKNISNMFQWNHFTHICNVLKYRVERKWKKNVRIRTSNFQKIKFEKLIDFSFWEAETGEYPPIPGYLLENFNIWALNLSFSQ